MFDIAFSEIFIISIVALVVIGPERLPKVARTLGALFGRLNRYVSDVKSDVEREMRLDDMKKLRAEVEQQAMSIEQSVVKELESTRVSVEKPVAEMEQSLADVMHETGQTGIDIQRELGQVAAGTASSIEEAAKDAVSAKVSPDGAVQQVDANHLPLTGESRSLQKNPANATLPVNDDAKATPGVTADLFGHPAPPVAAQSTPADDKVSGNKS